MAIKPADNETFYREVDEELRRDQLTGAWKRYGVAVIAALVLLLVAVAGILYWQNRKEARAGEQGERLSALFEEIQAGRVKDASAKLDLLAKDGNAGYRAAALLTKADLAVQSRNDAAAAAMFKQVAEDEDFAAPYRELALIRQTSVEFDTLPPAVVIARLKPLAVAGNAWLGSAGELVGLAYLKQGQTEPAARIFAAMAKDESLPPSIHSRAVQMAGALGVDALKIADGEAPAATATKESTR